jgi:hypothetical protein
MQRVAMTGRELKAAQIEKARRMIHAMHFEGAGYASIAGALNERKIPSRRGGKWVKSMVKRELAEVLKGTQKRPRSLNACGVDGGLVDVASRQRDLSWPPPLVSQTSA